MCLFPKIIKNRKYTANKKNGGNIPPIPDERVKYVPIGCQDCMECRKQKARGWQVRLLEDIKTHKNGRFITLTFSNEAIARLAQEFPQIEGYELDNAIATQGVRWFLERWRKKHGKSLRHWLVTELGHNGTENVHLHGIVWTDHELIQIEKIWTYGYVWKGKQVKDKLVNYVNEKTVNYITKYVSKQDLQHKTYKAKVLTSPGIGHNYTKGNDYTQNLYKGKETKETYRTRTGHKIALPIYWRNKIYSDQEREQLWLNRLDKMERWVCGEKVDISQTEKHYYRLLEWHRKNNLKLGYGNGQKDWNREQYERQRRALMHQRRIQKANAHDPTY